LWAGADLPPLPFCDRLGLVAAAYDLTFEASGDGTSIRLVPIPERVAITRTYRNVRPSAAMVEKLAARFPDAEVSSVGSDLVVRGRSEDQRSISDVLKGKPLHNKTVTPVKIGSIRVDHFKAEHQPVGFLIKELGRRLKLEVQFDSEAIAKASISLTQRVNISMEKGTVGELLQAITEPVGLEYELRGSVLTIRPAER
jgi:hypothetical protein